MQDFLKQIIKQAGEIALDHFHKGVTFETKSHLADLLTVADTSVSEFLIQKIHEKYPDHQISSEEVDKPVNPGARCEWVIDPIDGTRNFATGIPMWCIIIAFLEDGETILSAVYNPIADELFFAQKGKGATMNGMPIHVREKNDFDYAIGIFSRMPVQGKVYGSHIEEYKHFGKRMIEETGVWIHQFGCMLQWCYLASGGIDFCVQNAGLDHDYLGPALIVREAGGIVSDSDGNEWKRGRQDVVVANPILHSKVMKLFKTL